MATPQHYFMVKTQVNCSNFLGSYLPKETEKNDVLQVANTEQDMSRYINMVCPCIIVKGMLNGGVKVDCLLPLTWF